ncbi:Uma2 family endonuclease [Saccharopolyspora gregorii]|uniref:Uma2 family endonuclease n=1 Tax=Saccharopolyspora gregorii TaxID=33914 RepID=UPI0021ACABD9|nr:Uma2 family endonuclease [Saccharopolyspora gregorii]
MSAAPVLQESSWETFVQVWNGLDLPEGWRAEIIEERIVMSPPPDQNHNLIGSRVNKALVRALPDDWEVLQTQGIALPSSSRIVVPDLLVVLRERMTPAVVLPGEDALLSVEITSKSNADTDRTTKLRAYAQAGIPLYLLIDRFAPRWPTITLFSEPDGEAYRESHSVPFGKPLDLPAPFTVTLETEAFPR